MSRVSTSRARRSAARPSPGWGVQLWAGVLLAVAGTTAAPAYVGAVGPVPVVWLVVLAAVALPLGLLALGRRAGASSALAAAITTVACVGAALLVLRGAPAPDVELPAWRDSAGLRVLGPLVDGVPRLLSAPRPAPASAELLAPTALLVALVTVVVGVLLARRRSAQVAPVAGAAGLYVAGSLLTAGAGDRAGLLAAVLVVLVVGGWVLLARTAPPRVEGRGVTPGSGGRRALLRPGPGALPAVAAVVAVAAVSLVAGGLGRADAFEPRDLVSTPRVPLDVTSPLPDLAQWGEVTDTELLRVSGALPARLSLAVLPDFDGAEWRSTSDFVALGTVSGPALPPGQRTGTVDAVVEVRDLDGSWLPAAGTPSAVSLDDVAWDPQSGALVTAAGLRPGLTYAVQGQVDTPTDADLAAASVPSDVAVQRYLELPEVPASLVSWAQQGTAQARGRLQQAIALEELVRAGNALDPSAPTGSSYARLQDFLFGGADVPGAHRGTPEQFAAAFAVLGRAINLPTRLVVGFELPEAVDGVAVVTSGDATAWAEVYFTGWGWVAFDPTPEPDGSASDPVRQEVLDAMADDEAELVPTPPTLADDDAEAGDPLAPAEGVGAVTVVATVVAAVLLLGLAGAVVLVVLRLRRRRRHRRAGSVGAWREAVDALVLSGSRPGAAQTADEVARVLGERSAAPAAATALAERAERTAYAPTIGAGTGDSWDLCAEVVRGTRAAASRRRRVLWWLDPRVLRRR